MKWLALCLALCGIVALSEGHYIATLPHSDDLEDYSTHPQVIMEEYGDFEASDEDSPIRSSRVKRQSATNHAMNLALSHQDRNGLSRPVGRLHGQVDAFGSGRDLRNYGVHAGVGVGTVIHRSRNDRHSFGIGAYGSQSRSRFNGVGFNRRPNFGVGLGYKFRF